MIIASDEYHRALLIRQFLFQVGYGTTKNISYAEAKAINRQDTCWGPTRAVTMPTPQPTAVLEAVVMTTPGATNSDKAGTLTTPWLQSWVDTKTCRFHTKNHRYMHTCLYTKHWQQFSSITYMISVHYQTPNLFKYTEHLVHLHAGPLHGFSILRNWSTEISAS